ncbi:hypothetical protein [Desulfovibrio inopinatus]|uniref:hypothetical protein n=1 Tax=Desulfovibrio inopinatus TaxID=102109 RepID=UPI000425DB3B|nr:hypothetical protein [Desulfovibrio inopinatus]
MSQYPQYPYYQQIPSAYASGQQQATAWGASPGTAMVPNSGSWTQGWFAFTDPGYIKGLVVGAGVAYLVTNPTVQRSLVKGAVTLWTTIQGGVEEVKEQIEDIKAEMSMKDDAK